MILAHGNLFAALPAKTGQELVEALIERPGLRIERGIQLSALLRATVVAEHDPATDSLLLESVLTAAESIITYRRLYRSRGQLETLLDLLLLLWDIGHHVVRDRKGSHSRKPRARKRLVAGDVHRLRREGRPHRRQG